LGSTPKLRICCLGLVDPVKPLILILLFGLLVGCSSSLPLDLPSTQNHSSTTQVYHLMPGDEIELIASQRQDISGSYTLDPSGAIYIPVVGRIGLNGLSQSEAQASLNTELAQYYSSVSIILKLQSFQSNEFVVIMGEVREPGIYSIENRLTLLKAVGLARGFTKAANLSNIQLIRNAPDGEVIKIDFNQLLKESNYGQDLILLNDDLIYVPAKPLSNMLDIISDYLPLLQISLLTVATFNQLN
jgi:protein involved in polysaccharide export with SLBB domain